MAKDMKTRKGKDNIYYPYTSPDIVVDSTGESQTTKNNNMKNDIDSIKTDLGSEELTTTAKDVKGAINEVATQYKDIAKVIVGILKKATFIEDVSGQFNKLESLLNNQEITTYTITNNLTNVTNSNLSISAEENSSYIASLNADSGYTISSVIITMGGINITSSAYSNGSINISSITGNVIITATATENPEISGVTQSGSTLIITSAKVSQTENTLIIS